MNKKLLLAVMMASLLLAGCGNKPAQNKAPKQSTQSQSSVADSSSSKSSETSQNSKTSSTIDYNKYVKKTWIDKSGTNSASFCIYKIDDGKITGKFVSNSVAVPDSYDIGQLTGTVNNDTADCQFSDKAGNKGNMKLTFKSNGDIETSISLTEKSKYADEVPKEGTFEYKSYTTKDVKGLSIIKDQSFKVSLNSWGNVKFVSGKLTSGSHVPVVFYLTDNDGNILYNFDNALPYGMDVKAVSFDDVNKDSLKDVIVITASNEGANVAAVFLQKSSGTFAIDTNLDNDINSSGNNKDIKTIRNYLSKKF